MDNHHDATAGPGQIPRPDAVAIIGRLNGLVEQAQGILRDHLQAHSADGMRDNRGAHEAINRLLGLLDGPEQREVQGWAREFVGAELPATTGSAHGDPQRAAAMEAAAHLRDAADFNRSWTDGRRGDPSKDGPNYIARRIEAAEQLERWAKAIEELAAAGRAA